MSLAAPLDRGAGPPIVLLHAEGTDAGIWSGVADGVPGRVVAFDLRGHGASPVPPPPYAMGAMVRDVERAMEVRDLSGAVVVGLSLGGMIAQALAVKRLDLVRGLVLVNTAARIGTPARLAAHGAAVEAGGMEAVAADLAVSWRSRRGDAEALALRLKRCDAAGYRGAIAAISGTDLIAATSGLRLPTLVLAGADARAVPPDMARELVGLIPGARFALLRGAGHLAPLDAPEAMTDALRRFLEDIGQV